MTKRFSTVIVAMGLIGALAPDGSAGLPANLRAAGPDASA
jgi:hypothetical protein